VARAASRGCDWREQIASVEITFLN
jgi:hypothetical protein